MKFSPGTNVVQGHAPVRAVTKCDLEGIRERRLIFFFLQLLAVAYELDVAITKIGGHRRFKKNIQVPNRYLPYSIKSHC